MSNAINKLVTMIEAGDLDEARAWATENAAMLGVLRYDRWGRAAVAHACNRWGAPMVWPWGDSPAPVGSEGRVLVAIRAGRVWRCSEDTIAVVVACGWASFSDGRWSVA